MPHRPPPGRRFSDKPASPRPGADAQDDGGPGPGEGPASGWDVGESDLKPQRISKEQAALLLITETALGELSVAEARQIVNYMTPKRLRPGTALIRQGEKQATHFMALVLDGTIQVVAQDHDDKPAQVLDVLGPGAVIGEMSLVDGDARSASCVALGHVGVGILTRKALWKMMDAEPSLAARLVLILMRHVTGRMRETARRLKIMAQLNDALQAELKSLGPGDSLLDMPDTQAVLETEQAQEQPAAALPRNPIQFEPFTGVDTVRLWPRKETR